MINTNITCDCCGVLKLKSNNWYTISYDLNNWVTIQKAELSTSSNKLDACGEECATKLIWENLNASRIEDPYKEVGMDHKL